VPFYELSAKIVAPDPVRSVTSRVWKLSMILPRHANGRRRMSLASVSNATRPFTQTTTMIKRLAATIGVRNQRLQRRNTRADMHVTGELEVDYDADIWADHDENCHGTIDTDSMRAEYPEGFVWTCCDKPGDEAGCTWGRHEADPTKSRRESGEEPIDSDDYEDGDEI